MLTAAHLLRRATAIMTACGFVLDRDALANPTPAVNAAWSAYKACWHLDFARVDLGFLSSRMGPGAPSLRWAYVAYRHKAISCRRNVHLAGEYLAKAEAMMRELEIAR